MNFIPADTVSLVIFSLFSVGMFATLFYALGKASESKKLRLIFVVLLTVLGYLSGSGFLERHIFPAVPLVFVLILLLAVGFSFSKSGKQLSQHFSLQVLIGFQSFRLFLELILHHWAKIGTVPPTMTWTGQNWDIITGIVSLVSIPFIPKSKAQAWIAQLVGFVLLLNVFRVVVMSSPLPFSWPLENPLQLVFHLPYVLIAPLFVMPALVGHLLVFRTLLRNGSRDGVNTPEPGSTDF